MNNKIEHFISEKMYSDKFQAKGIICVFGTLGVAALIGSLWNPWQLATTLLCIVIVIIGIRELKIIKNESKKKQ